MAVRDEAFQQDGGRGHTALRKNLASVLLLVQYDSMTVNVCHASVLPVEMRRKQDVTWREYEPMNPKNVYCSVTMALAVVFYTSSVVLSAPLTSISQTSQSEGKRGKHEPCTEVTMRTGGDSVDTRSNSECIDGKRVSVSGQVQPYAAMVIHGLDSPDALLGLPCSGTPECREGILATDPGSREQLPALALSLPIGDLDRDSTVLTATRGKSLMSVHGADFTKLVMERNTVVQMGDPMSRPPIASDTGNIFWGRLLNVGPLLLLLLDKLLGRL